MIKNYIFDFGDVFLNLDKQATARELFNFGMKKFTEEMLHKNNLYEKGLVSTDAFLDFYQNQFPNATKNQLKNAWNSILLNFPKYRLTFIENFSKANTCYLLSNINEMHLDFIKNILDKDFYKRFINCFTKVYYTHEINMRKPTKEIFNFVLKDSNLKPKECFFIDDTKENILTAKRLGIKCWHIDSLNEDVINLVEKTKKI
jgi:putative hydrolase of the HAD superfamily